MCVGNFVWNKLSLHPINLFIDRTISWSLFSILKVYSFFSEYLGIARNCFIHNRYCNVLLPNSCTGALCKNLTTFSIDLTPVTFNLEQFVLSICIGLVKDKCSRIADIKISPSLVFF